LPAFSLATEIAGGALAAIPVKSDARGKKLARYF
jgi:hypothetical protein